MTITGVTLETTNRYGTDRHADPTPVLQIAVKIPGGEAIYRIDLPPGVKESLEQATQLKGK